MAEIVVSKFGICRACQKDKQVYLGTCWDCRRQEMREEKIRKRCR